MIQEIFKAIASIGGIAGLVGFLGFLWTLYKERAKLKSDSHLNYVDGRIKTGDFMEDRVEKLTKMYLDLEKRFAEKEAVEKGLRLEIIELNKRIYKLEEIKEKLAIHNTQLAATLSTKK